MTKQPVAVVAAIVTAVKAVLAALVITKVIHLDAVQVAQLAIAVESALAVPAAIFVHNRVTPVPKAPKPLDPKLIAAVRLALEAFKDDYVAATAPAVARLVELRQAEARAAKVPAENPAA